MKNNIIVSVIIMFLSFSFFSCKKKGCTDNVAANFDVEAEKDDGTCIYGGLGGSTSIVAKPQHHGNAIYSLPAYPDTAFIKFNAVDFPGDNPAFYDLVIAGNEGEDHVKIEGLKVGKYYIFMAGKDTSIPPPNQRVKGGIPYDLKKSSGEVVIPVPVTED